MPSDDHSPARLSRRGALSLIAVTAAGGTLIPRQAFAQEAGTNADIAGLLPGADVCVITPEVTEGPYYFDPALERQDVTEGRPGVRTQVRLQVVDAQCKPMAGARVVGVAVGDERARLVRRPRVSPRRADHDSLTGAR